MSRGRKLGYSFARLNRNKTPTLMNISWASGIFEGEGSACKKSICVAQKDPEILYKLQSLFGGSVRKETDSSTRFNNGCYHWFISGARARGFAMTIYSLLSSRRKLQLQKFELVGPYGN